MVMNNEAMRSALAAVMPDHAAREKLARRLSDPSELSAFTADELAQFEAEHEREIVYLVGAIETRNDDANWTRRARQALRILRLHKRWISAERAARKKKATAKEYGKGLQALAAAKVEVVKTVQATQKAAAEARMARIAAANDADRKTVAAFKAVAREVLGMEMYDRLWELTRQRLSREDE